MGHQVQQQNPRLMLMIARAHQQLGHHQDAYLCVFDQISRHSVFVVSRIQPPLIGLLSEICRDLVS
jgi:hypothetical protein